MLVISKEIKIYSMWMHQETIRLTMSDEDEKAFWVAAQTEASVGGQRTNSKYVDVESRFYGNRETISLVDKTLLRFRSAIGAKLFDSKLGDWPFDKADAWADPETVADLKTYGITGISAFIWRI